jgi:hypothetical protein
MLIGALGCFYGDEKKLWEEYNKNFRQTILKSQKEDGSILIEARKGADKPIDGKKGYGPELTSAIYGIVLQLHKGNLAFSRLKPIDSSSGGKE